MKNSLKCLLVAIPFVLLVSNAAGKEPKTGGLNLSSPVFENNGDIPAKYTCDGANVNPALLIGNAPPNAKSLALIVDDPDAPAGTFVHWVLWNIDPGTKEIRENSSPRGARQGLNDFRRHSYDGPCPPSGSHRYFFSLYALDIVPDLGANPTKADVEKIMKGHIIEKTQIIGLYKRR